MNKKKPRKVHAENIGNIQNRATNSNTNETRLVDFDFDFRRPFFSFEESFRELQRNRDRDLDDTGVLFSLSHYVHVNCD